MPASNAPATTAPPPARGWGDRAVLLAAVLLVPASIASHLWLPGPVTFIVSALALVPLARFMGEATETIAAKLGSALGGLMNASFGNAAELIIALAALREGQVEVVKASITGAVLGNLLLVLGGAVLAGGIRFNRQTFNSTAALSGMAMMFLALTSLIVPDLFHLTRGEAANPVMLKLSVAISIVLLIIYALSLLFALGTHAHLYESDEEDGHAEAEGSVGGAILTLVLSTAGVIVVAELLVRSIEPALESFGWTHTFVGVVVLAIVGNAAEHSTAVMMALKNKMDLSLNIAAESSKQIALFVAPVLVLCSLLFKRPFTLELSHMEVVGMAIGVGGSTLIALDGESNWLEGVMLLGVYVILAVAFFFVP